MYFPPIGSTNWETKTIQSLNWNLVTFRLF
jgi:hypothetical protein